MMKTRQRRAFGKPTTAPELIEATRLEAGAGQGLVALEAPPINPADRLLITGRYGVRPRRPAALRAEGVGRIVAARLTVDPVRIGEHLVVARPSIPENLAPARSPRRGAHDPSSPRAAATTCPHEEQSI
jgi:NADPH:quinone reductase-like Zn-dependent oxidoreductase